MATTARGRRTRQRIVDAAVAVVAERGAQAASLDEVRARSATSKSQLYHYFSDRDDLLRAVAAATADMVLAAQAEEFAGLGTPDGLRRWADARVAYCELAGGGTGCPIAGLVAQLGEHDDAARALLAGGLDRWEAALHDGLAAQQRDGLLRAEADPAALATAVLAAFQGGAVLAQARRDATPLRAALDGALALVDTWRPAPRRGSRGRRG